MLSAVTCASVVVADEYYDPMAPSMSSGPSANPYRNGGNLSVPGPPTAPMAPPRPATWPGGPEPAGPTVATTPYPVPPQAPPPELCEGAQIVARVGTEVVLAAEVRAMAVQTILAEVKRKKLSPTSEELRELVDRIWPAYLDQAVEAKLLYFSARRAIPEEGLKQFMDRVPKIFEEEPSGQAQLLKLLDVATPEAAEAKLQSLGTSLEWQRRLFADRIVSQQAVLKEIDQDRPISHEQMLLYYQQHLADFEHQGRARWQQLSVYFSRWPDKSQAWTALARMGNSLQDGADFAEMARKFSNGPTAANGGLRDWTTQGSLVSKAIDRAIFSLPVGSLSPILEDEQGFHIVRVLERKDAYRTSFAEAQETIQKELRREQFSTAFAAHVQRLKTETPIWTIRDDAPGRGGSVGDRRGAGVGPTR